MKQLRPLMLAGTASDVGKSVLAAGLCRIFRQDGYSPAPFKAQNLALNSYVTPDGLEIGRAQAVQAEACGLTPQADMNPILLKPQGGTESQLVLNGTAESNTDAYGHRKKVSSERLRREACAAFDRLAARHSPIVMEGAGSIAELNLREGDIVNMSMARHAGAAVVIVADIERGGVFASAYGSVMLQSEEDRRLIRGLIVNKFRGDTRLFDDGVRILEYVCRVPVLGVVPYFDDIHIEEEDSISLKTKNNRTSNDGRVNVGVVKLRHISNFTDFDMLEQDPRVNLYYCENAGSVDEADIVILPGCKNTIADLGLIRANGMAEAVIKARRDGKTILGICGGYQMMGAYVADPDGVEGDITYARGLGLLPVGTQLMKEKTLRQVTFGTAQAGKMTMSGYEIHNGATTPTGDGPCRPLFVTAYGGEDGCTVGPKCMGTYIHGALDNAEFVDILLSTCGKSQVSRRATVDYAAFKESQYDLLANRLRRHLDIGKIYDIMKKGK